ncbi:uncharacterized protein LOC111244357 isoform X3 [Varroa destructor]|uniref:Uncharacterized protein n=1 Tax=Varroa destructor TaxID=109461 RepID=A0A7M7JAU4_VARDE|nr:uncharacterized protein LOC111244357 isoform X3 [Varroa destructor]
MWWLVILQLVSATPYSGDDKLRRVCLERNFNEAGGTLIEPSNRTTCALFAEQGLYVPYKLKATERNGVIHLTGTVFGAGSYDGLLVTCGQTGTTKCLQIYSSPGEKMNNAFILYSNAEIDLGIQKLGPVTYVASLDCKDGVPGQRYFEFRKAPSKDELDNIKAHYGVTIDSIKLFDCLENKNKVFEAS